MVYNYNYNYNYIYFLGYIYIYTDVYIREIYSDLSAYIISTVFIYADCLGRFSLNDIGYKMKLVCSY